MKSSESLLSASSKIANRKSAIENRKCGVSMALMILALTQQKEGSPAETILLGNLLSALIAIPFYFYETLTPVDAAIIRNDD